MTTTTNLTEIKIGSIVRVIKYDWIMKVSNIETRNGFKLIHLENTFDKIGNAGSYLESDLIIIN